MPTPPCNLLVVDDSRTSRDMLCSQLERHGYHAVGAASGQEMLDLLQERTFDLVLLDIEMPGMTGIELTKNLGNKRPIVIFGSDAV